MWCGLGASMLVACFVRRRWQWWCRRSSRLLWVLVVLWCIVQSRCVWEIKSLAATVFLFVSLWRLVVREEFVLGLVLFAVLGQVVLCFCIGLLLGWRSCCLVWLASLCFASSVLAVCLSIWCCLVAVVWLWWFVCLCCRSWCSWVLVRIIYLLHFACLGSMCWSCF